MVVVENGVGDMGVHRLGVMRFLLWALVPRAVSLYPFASSSSRRAAGRSR